MLMPATKARNESSQHLHKSIAYIYIYEKTNSKKKIFVVFSSFYADVLQFDITTCTFVHKFCNSCPVWNHLKTSQMSQYFKFKGQHNARNVIMRPRGTNPTNRIVCFPKSSVQLGCCNIIIISNCFVYK